MTGKQIHESYRSKDDIIFDILSTVQEYEEHKLIAGFTKT